MVVRQFAALVGTAFAPAKSKTLGPSADFIGLVHDVGDCLQTGHVSLQPRPSLVEKASALLQDAMIANYLSPAQASKARGMLGFVFTGAFGKVGRAGFGPLVQREYSDKSPFSLSHSLLRSLQYLQDLVQLAPARIISVSKVQRLPLYVASDARLDDDSPASVAVLI